MNGKPKPSSKRSPATTPAPAGKPRPSPRPTRRRGMTLVEVVGGLALLGTLLVAVLLARGRYIRQAAIADRRLQAVAAADALLAQWHQDPRSLPRAASGDVPGDGQFTWRTRTVSNGSVA